MAEQVKGFAEHFWGFKRHIKLAVVTFAAILTLGVGFAFSLPDIYKSSAFILIEEPDIPEQIVQSTITSQTTRMLTMLNEKILTISNLVRIMEQFDLYADERRNTPQELLAIDMRKAVSIEIQSRDSVTAQGIPAPQVVGYSISFEDEDPDITKVVVEELVSLYMEGNLKVRSEQTAETSDFLSGEIEQLESQIAEIEGELARFKEQNADVLPSLSSVNLSMLNRADADLLNIERSLSSLEENRISIKAQMATVEPTMAVRLSDGTVAMSPEDQLKALKTQLSVYESKYSDDHPDVIGTRRDIASLQERFGIDVDLVQLDDSIQDAKSDLAVANEKYSDDHPDVIQLTNTLNRLEAEKDDVANRRREATLVPDNPAYIQLESALAQLNAEENALKEQQAEFRRRMADYEGRLMRTPQIEKELSALSRTLASTSNRYWVLRDKQFAAQMGQTLETQSKGEEMILIEPPRVPLTPEKPNRGAIISLVLLFAMVAGVGITQLADALDHSIRDSAGIVSVQGIPPLVEIPYIYNEDELAGALRMRKVMLGSLPVGLLGIILVVHFVIQPLDVLFYAIVARLGF